MDTSVTTTLFIIKMAQLSHNVHSSRLRVKKDFNLMFIRSKGCGMLIEIP